MVNQFSEFPDRKARDPPSHVSAHACPGHLPETFLAAHSQPASILKWFRATITELSLRVLMWLNFQDAAAESIRAGLRIANLVAIRRFGAACKARNDERMYV